jgi:uncharacterized protein
MIHIPPQYTGPPYTERTYRKCIRPEGLSCFQVVVRQTDLWVCADRPLEQETRDLVLAARQQLETYIGGHPDFLHALLPLQDDPYAPPMVREMTRASRKAGVGPMAAVAGAIAQEVGEGLLTVTDQVIVENGGDVFLKADRPLTVSIFAGRSSLSNRLGLMIPTQRMPLGVCASSGTIGHSLSRGIADAVCVVSASTPLADSTATAMGNRIKKKRDLEDVARWAGQIDGILGGVAIVNDAMATWGDIELVEI